MHPFFDLPTPHLFAHQGASGERPENTIPAFERAVAQGIAFLEMDCHGTRDGEIVICHDAHVDRTTDGSGPIGEHDFAALERLDAGGRFSPDGHSFPFRGRGIRIPRLQEVLERFPESRINLEIKQRVPPIADEVVRVIQRAGAGHRVLLAAAEDDIMESIHKLAPGTAFGSSTGDVLAFYTAVRDDAWDGFEPRGQALQIPTEFAGNDLITPESVAAARRVGLFMHIWTINDPAEMRRLLALGVDGLMSDYPARLLQEARAAGAAR